MTDPVELEPYRLLKGRDSAAGGLFVVEGRFLVERLLASELRMHSVLCVPRAAALLRAAAGDRCPVLVREPEEMERTVGFPFHRGVLACGYRPPPVAPAELASPGPPGRKLLLVVCPELNDDGNLGSLVRSAAAFAAAGVLLGPRCCDPWSRRALRHSMGAVFSLPLARAGSDDEILAALRSGGVTLYAAANRPEAAALDDVEPAPRVAVAIGNEGAGLDERWIRASDLVVRIPVSAAVDSLNAGVAAGILLYRLSRPR